VVSHIALYWPNRESLPSLINKKSHSCSLVSIMQSGIAVHCYVHKNATVLSLHWVHNCLVLVSDLTS
jgi:hypothetical protein